MAPVGLPAAQRPRLVLIPQLERDPRVLAAEHGHRWCRAVAPPHSSGRRQQSACVRPPRLFGSREDRRCRPPGRAAPAPAALMLWSCGRLRPRWLKQLLVVGLKPAPTLLQQQQMRTGKEAAASRPSKLPRAHDATCDAGMPALSVLQVLRSLLLLLRFVRVGPKARHRGRGIVLSGRAGGAAAAARRPAKPM